MKDGFSLNIQSLYPFYSWSEILPTLQNICWFNLVTSSAASSEARFSSICNTCKTQVVSYDLPEVVSLGASACAPQKRKKIINMHYSVIK